MNPANQNVRFQQIVALTSVVLFVIKVLAWYLTQSVAILTDALESTINVISGFVGLYSLYLSAQPKDRNHPYGHGKVEFVSAAIEGTLISVAGLIIIYEAINNLRHPHTLGQLDTGILLVAVTAVINYVLGYMAVKMGTKNNSLALTASGKHLQSDTYSTLGIIAGLILLYVTHLTWIDSAVAFLFAFLIMFTGYKIVRGSLAGIMDEADEALLDALVTQLQAARRSNWIDLHNLRIIKYGSTLHLDCHMTVPWYLNVHEAHDEIEALAAKVRENFGESVELFVHTDGCMDFSCNICTKEDCQVRKAPFIRKITWTIGNISSDSKHRITEAV